MKIGIFGNSYQSGKLNNIREIFEKLNSLDVAVRVESLFFNYLDGELDYRPVVAGIIGEDAVDLDMIISLGGDGTFLKTTAWVARQEIPIVGINIGRLGFLAYVSTNEIEQTLEKILHGNYSIEKRSLLEINTANGIRTSNFALNEIAIIKRDTSAIITIHAWLNDDYLTTYLGDGLLVATPTGSTAYSMSVNGPIIVPDARNFVLSPVAPHSLNVRPLVIPEDYKIRLKVESRNSNFLVSLDGRSEIFLSGTEFNIRKADFSINLVKLEGHDFYSTLRNKLLWGTDNRVFNESPDLTAI
ncbi:MAG: NAD kinase [Dysgonamonadaceae bacterium]|jgi:NAD+ kinase|nr:NAD kinase [Dysgonamonadaceae bacterium]